MSPIVYTDPKSYKRSICAVCGKKQNIEVLYPATCTERGMRRLFSARRLPDQIHYRIVRCLRCGLVFSSPILPPKTITQLYKRSTCTYNEQIPFLTKTYLRLFDSAPCTADSPKVLEIGCGNGFFLDALYARGLVDVHGVEPGKDMVRIAPRRIKSKIVVDVFKKNQFSDSSFDVICAFHTLDHLTDPNGFAQTALNLLKPGGILIIVVHDTDGLSVRLVGERSPIFDIEHIYLFNKKTLTRLFLQNGFEVIRVNNLVNTYPLSYWLRMSGLPHKVREWIETALTITRTRQLPFSFPGGNISLIAQKP